MHDCRHVICLQPMKHWYKPLAFYVAMEAAALLCRVALQAAGFQRHVWMGLPYYTKNMPAQPVRHSIDIPPEAYVRGRRRSFQAAAMPAQSFSMLLQRHSTAAQRHLSAQQTPLVLLHGIGMGLIPYISMLFNMVATGQHHGLRCLTAGLLQWSPSRRHAHLSTGECCALHSAARNTLFLYKGALCL